MYPLLSGREGFAEFIEFQQDPEGAEVWSGVGRVVRAESWNHLKKRLGAPRGNLGRVVRRPRTLGEASWGAVGQSWG